MNSRGRSTSRWMSLTISLAVSLGSISAPARELEPISEQRLGELLLSLEHVPLTASVAEKFVSDSKRCLYATAVIPVVSPWDGKVHKQIVYITRPRIAKPVPVVMIVPTIQAYKPILEGHAATEFCEKGIAAIVADVNDNREPATMPSWDTEDRNHRTALQSLRTVIDYIEMQPAYDSKRIGLLGLSLGGMTSAMLAGVDDRLRAVFTAASGGNFAHILSHSAHFKITSLRDRRMAYLKMTDVEKYEEFLAGRLLYDPIYFAKRIPRGKLMMMTVKYDTRVPHIAQDELWAALGKPKRIILNKGHAGSIIDLVYRHMDTVIKFMRDEMDIDPL